jgi:hypothetical protein
VKKYQESGASMSGDEQILLQEISRLLTYFSLRKGSDADIGQTMHVFTQILEGFTEHYSDFVFTFLGHFHSAFKRTARKSEELPRVLCEYLSVKGIPDSLGRSEKYCKVTEMLLKIAHTSLKNIDKPILTELFANQQTQLA